MLYRLYGLIVDSKEFLPMLTSVDQANVDVLVRRGSFQKPFPSPSNWFMHWRLPEGELWLSFAKVDGGYLLRFNELADFFVSDGGREIIYIHKAEIPSKTIHHLLLDQVIPLVINLKGGEVLHASAVLMPKGIIAFTGPTGYGKSTLAGSFLQAGDSVLADDCLPLVEKSQNIYAIPAYPGLRLWEDSLALLFGDNGHESVAHYTIKQRVYIGRKFESYCSEPEPLRCIYFIIVDPSEVGGKADIVIWPLSPKDSFIALIRCAFRFDITNRNMLIRQFQFFKQVISIVPIRLLIFPRDFNLLPAVREAILNDLKKLDN